MPSHRDRILDFIFKFPGRDDDEIAATLGISPRQTLNIVCRKLCEDGLIGRERGPSGKRIVWLPPVDNPQIALVATDLRIKVC